MIKKKENPCIGRVHYTQLQKILTPQEHDP